MQISPETKKISELFPIEGSQQYEIPIYQRNYSWTNKQIDSLIDDISAEQKGYYIGNILVTHDKERGLEEIVDGQQRLTTIALILLGIYEVSKTFETSNAKYVGALQQDIKRKLIIDEDVKKPRYIMLERDREIYDDLLNILVDKPTRGWRNRVFGKRHHYIKETIKENFEDFLHLKNFYEKLNAIEILKISVTNTADAFSIFSALNSKGLPLTLVDLLKNEYLKKALNENVTKETAVETWEELIKMFEIEAETNMTNVTQFLLNNYDAFETTERSSITKGKALDIYTGLINEGSNYINILRDRAKYYNYLKQLNNNGSITFGEDVDKLINNLNYLDPSQSYPLLLLILIKKEELVLEERHLIDIFSLTISFFVRRNITLRPKASNVRAMFVGLNRDIIKEELSGDDVVNKIKKEMSNKSDSDDDVKKVLLDDGIFNKHRSTTRLILISLERKYGTYFDKSKKDSLEEHMDNNQKKSVLRWTIEHILPQGKNITDYWVEMLKTSNMGDDIETIHEEYTHKLGNLTLTPYNPEMSNKTFNEKKNHKDNDNEVGLKMGLYLNQSIENSENGETWEDKESWTPEDIDRRTKILSDALIEIYNFN